MREFIKNGHKVYIVSPAEKRLGESTSLIKGENYTILRVKIGNAQKTHPLKKAIALFRLEFQYISAIKKHFNNIDFDLLLYSTPPINLLKPIRYILKNTGAKSYLMLKDIFPQNAVDLQMIAPNGFIHRYFSRKERKLYEISEFIGCMSKANADYVLQKNPMLKNVHILPNSIEPLVVVDKSNNRAIREQHGIPHDIKVLFYGGNLGKPQTIPFIIECLKENCNKNDRFFLICGTGTEYYKLASYIEEHLPNNVKLINELPKDQYDELIKACDIGLIFLDRRFTIPNFPSRLLSYMENSMPVIACTDVNTDLGEIISIGDFGWSCESCNVSDFTEIIDTINSEDIVIKGKNARKYLESHYTVEDSYKIIINNLQSLIKIPMPSL